MSKLVEELYEAMATGCGTYMEASHLSEILTYIEYLEANQIPEGHVRGKTQATEPNYSAIGTAIEEAIDDLCPKYTQDNRPHPHDTDNPDYTRLHLVDFEEVARRALAAAQSTPAVQVEPVSAQVRYRRPEKGLPNWSPWQPAKVDETKPTYYFDEQGWEVEYRLLYTAPQPAEQPVFTVGTDLSDGELSVVVMKHENDITWVIHSEVISLPEQQPDVAQLVEALEQVIKSTPSGGPLWHGSEQIVEARAALAAYREEVINERAYCS